MTPEFSNAAVVLLGKFDPDAFLPEALVGEKIITKKEAESVKYNTILRGQVLQFQLPWAKVLIAQDRYAIETSEAPYVRICDFTTKALSDLPTKSVVTAFGINLESHFNLGNIAARDEIGKKLAPPTAWGKWGEKVLSSMHGDAQENPQHGGMVLIQMRQPFVAEQAAGWMDVWVGPSERIPNSTGVFFRTNHHHQHPKKKADDKVAEEKRDFVAEGQRLLELLSRDLMRQFVQLRRYLKGC